MKNEPSAGIGCASKIMSCITKLLVARHPCTYTYNGEHLR